MQHSAPGSALRGTNFSSRQEALGSHTHTYPQPQRHPRRHAGFRAQVCLPAPFRFHSLWLIHENKSAHQMAHIPLPRRTPFTLDQDRLPGDTSSPEQNQGSAWLSSSVGRASSQQAKVAGSIPRASLPPPSKDPAVKVNVIKMLIKPREVMKP